MLSFVSSIPLCSTLFLDRSSVKKLLNELIKKTPFKIVGI